MIKKSLLTIFTTLLIVVLMSIPTQSKALNITDVFNTGDGFLNNAADANELFDEETQKDTVQSLYWIGLTIAIAVAIIIGVVLGIQLVTSGVSGQAKVKQRLLPYAIGVIVALGAFGIWGLTMGVLKSVF